MYSTEAKVDGKHPKEIQDRLSLLSGNSHFTRPVLSDRDDKLYPRQHPRCAGRDQKIGGRSCASGCLLLPWRTDDAQPGGFSGSKVSGVGSTIYAPNGLPARQHLAFGELRGYVSGVLSGANRNFRPRRSSADADIKRGMRVVIDRHAAIRLSITHQSVEQSAVSSTMSSVTA